MINRIFRKIGYSYFIFAISLGLFGKNACFAETVETTKMRQAILYLRTVFRYDLVPPDESLRNLRKVAKEFNPEDVKSDPHLRLWFEENAKRLILDSPNLEYSIEILDTTGIREKLVACSNANDAGSMGWWLSKKALPSFEVGQGKGKTAKALGLTTAFHEPRDAPWDDGLYHGAFHSMIAQNRTGHPNILLSRRYKVSESAPFGEGHYAKIGRASRGTAVSILYWIDPHARSGSDFEIHGSGVIKFLNRKAITTSTCSTLLHVRGNRPKAPEISLDSDGV